MPISTLLFPPTAANLPAWQFDHAMAHRNLLGGMSIAPSADLFAGTTTGLSAFTAAPYFIDPTHNHGAWHLDHNQAHSDAQTTLPRFFSFTGVGYYNPTTDFTDMDFRSTELLTWWTFSNHQQHATARSVLPQELRFPFW